MYNDEFDRFELPEDYSASDLQEDLLAILSGWNSVDGTELDPEGSEIHTFEQAGVLTCDKGLVLRLPGGKEFQITIVRSR